MTNVEKIADDEEFRKIEGFDYYWISNYGRCYSDYSKKILKNGDNGNGYKKYVLRDRINKKYYTLYIHRLVAIHFIPNTMDFPEVNHKDLDKENNVYSNLEWCTGKYNSQHSILNQPEKYKYKKHEKHHLSNTIGKPTAVYSNEHQLINVFRSREICSDMLNVGVSTIKESIRNNRTKGNKGFYFKNISLDFYNEYIKSKDC